MEFTERKDALGAFLRNRQDTILRDIQNRIANNIKEMESGKYSQFIIYFQTKDEADVFFSVVFDNLIKAGYFIYRREHFEPVERINDKSYYYNEEMFKEIIVSILPVKIKPESGFFGQFISYFVP